MSIRSEELRYLVTKVGEELHQPKQFLSPRRCLALVSNGLNYLNGVTRQVQMEYDLIEKKVDNDLLMKEEGDGLVIAYSPTNYIQALIFPFRSKISFKPPIALSLGEFEDINYKFQFPATTSTTINGVNIPDQGYKDVTKIHHGFRDGNPLLLSQYGGIHVKNGKIELVNYNRMQKLKKTKFDQDQKLIGANWYVDSNNLHLALATSEHNSKRQYYNGIGLITFQDGEKRYLHVSQMSDYARHHFVHSLARWGKELVSLAQVAAIVNVVGTRLGGKSWVLCGLEYNGGEIRSKQIGSEFAHFVVDY